MAFIFNKITVRPQLPKRIGKLYDISYNMWWSWNTEFLRLFKNLDIDLWEKCEKSPVKFLKLVSQEKLEWATNDNEFLKQYDKVVNNFENYMNSKTTWFSKKYPDNKDDLIAYFSAEYGLDETVPMYAGGLGILSGDHLKSASDMGIPLVAVGLLYKHGYFHQELDSEGNQKTLYRDIDINYLPLKPVKDKNGKDLMISLKFPLKKLSLKVWSIDVGRVKLYLLDSDIDDNIEEYKDITTTLYGGDQERRVQQEMVLGMGGVSLLNNLGYNPNVYHMNEGHSAFLTLELMKNIIKEKELSFQIARDIVTSKTVFTTHTPVPAGNDIFPIELILKYFDKYWTKLGISKEEFLSLGMKPDDEQKNTFNMGILALKIAGRKNGVSKLHGAVSRELFSEVWAKIPSNETPIDYVTNGVHTCSWLAPTMKDLYNEYLRPFWQDNIQDDEIWKDIFKIPDEELWKIHMSRKEKLLKIVKDSTTNILRKDNYSYDEIDKIVGGISPDILTIGFARRFATYKRATLIFRDLERITKIFNEKNKPIQIIFAGKAHPQDKEGQDLIKYIHELSLKPQFKGKIFILENYNIGMSRYLVSGVDVWLNNPRRPLEASGTSGQKAAINGVINFSVLDGWWAEGYNQKNGWAIGTNADYKSYDEQDDEDAKSLYNTLENKIIPMYYSKGEKGYSEEWLEMMKNCIVSNAGRFSTARMLQDYLSKLYIPVSNLGKKYSGDLSNILEYEEWKDKATKNWKKIKITQSEANYNDVTVDAGNKINVECFVELPGDLIKIENVEMQVYYGKITEEGVVDDIQIETMTLEKNKEDDKYKFSANIELKSGGDYGYTFRAIPKHDMLLDWANLNLIKWIND